MCSGILSAWTTKTPHGFSVISCNNVSAIAAHASGTNTTSPSTPTATPPCFFDQDIDFNRRDPKILVDAFKMAEGGLDASIMVAYLAQKERTPEAHLAATAKADGILDRLTAMVEHCPSARMAFSPEEVRANKAAGYRASSRASKTAMLSAQI